MALALRLARRGLGRVAPNPAVGCVIVRDGVVVGRGWTQPGGRPHAEVGALAAAGEQARGATAYVTLEPCSHHGKTPPCCDALIDAGVARVVVAVQDPDGRVNGQGLARLKQAGITVTTGLCETEARTLNEGFMLAKTAGRPVVTLKMATSLDGKIATKTGNSKWITGDAARRYGHLLRASHDAIMVGVGTALADNPSLTCRIDGLLDRSPVRIVADTRLSLPLTSELVKTARQVPVWIVTVPGNDPDRLEAFRDLGVEIIEVKPSESGFAHMKTALDVLAQRGITRLLVEGGSHLQASLVKEHLADYLMWFRAAKIIGGDGISALQSIGLTNVGLAPSLELLETRRVGGDQLEKYLLRK
ncbi:riboflavin biosynthesis protein RibD [Sneathiella chinensis]|uniref:Riboflavin biosynthesis protein RibD n=2 Tax=Sneathiella chinensis TaxID=349750 RepID=A0ABQ5U2T1_9PROT|nr:bifunctional diaminohydroxyphosphoribosylaminopyrimidine deaminase/5-amino-6-(5-phosphoribosylamino)uracil reductase RibD [Sneathiella chinensis]GLQ06469.1 riboflavin biosynthesis protein RibD [Sneathiella chinensis]